MGADGLFEPFDLSFLHIEHILILSNFLHESFVIGLKLIFRRIILILHGQNIFIDGDLIFEEIIQLIYPFSLNQLLIFQ